jgi:hypothetical protein
VRLRAVNGGTAIRLDGHVDAAVTQRCVVTLGPVPETVSSDFVLLFTREEPGEEVDVAFEDEIVEPLEGSEIDIGEASAQELAVALEPYPRADGVSLETIASPEALADLESLDGPESPDRPESLQGPGSDGEEGGCRARSGISACRPRCHAHGRHRRPRVDCTPGSDRIQRPAFAPLRCLKT